MNILILGNGGREHALAWKLKQSKNIKKIFISEGNAGTIDVAESVIFKNKNKMLEFCKDKKIGLVVVGPDILLKEGIVDFLNKNNVKVFGPTRLSSKIEWSKSFGKQLMLKNSIPTAKYKEFKNENSAISFLEKSIFPVVIKDDGLAYGKGVVVAKNYREGEKFLKQVFLNKNAKVVVEEFMTGKEVSFHAFCDGEDFKLFPVSKDHKRIFENNKGANTGGMGTVVPVPTITKKDIKEVETKIIKPFLQVLKDLGTPFVGVLFPGVMFTKDGPKVIEFNARFGDPETESYMRILKTDLLDILLACVNGNLKKQNIKWDSKSACNIVLASKGYPGKYEINKEISGLDIHHKDVVIFHSGTKKSGNKVLTNGGRVFGVSAVGKNIQDVRKKAYAAINSIKFAGKVYRRDINI